MEENYYLYRKQFFDIYAVSSDTYILGNLYETNEVCRQLFRQGYEARFFGESSEGHDINYYNRRYVDILKLDMRIISTRFLSICEDFFDECTNFSMADNISWHKSSKFHLPMFVIDLKDYNIAIGSNAKPPTNVFKNQTIYMDKSPIKNYD